MAISTAPVGPELDADVVRCHFGEGAHPDWWRCAFSTDRVDAMCLLEGMAITATITIRSQYDEADDAAGGNGERWIVEEVGNSEQRADFPPDPYECEGTGKTLMEAICRCATHMRDAE